MTAGTIDHGTTGRSEDTRSRLLETAVRLFSSHGYEGTSLQMIADELGVTKAAVYYHFKTKGEIADAAARDGLAEFLRIITEAESQRRRSAQVEVMVRGVIDLVIRYRALLALFTADQGLVRALHDKGMLKPDIKERTVAVLAGPDADARAEITVHVLLSGLMMCGAGDELAPYDEDELREHLYEISLRVLGRPRRRTTT